MGATWADGGARDARAAYRDLGDSLVPVRTPIGDASILASDARVSVSPWRGLSSAERDAVEAEVASLPLPNLAARPTVTWRAGRTIRLQPRRGPAC